MLLLTDFSKCMFIYISAIVSKFADTICIYSTASKFANIIYISTIVKKYANTICISATTSEIANRI